MQVAMSRSTEHRVFGQSVRRIVDIDDDMSDMQGSYDEGAFARQDGSGEEELPFYKNKNVIIVAGLLLVGIIGAGAYTATRGGDVEKAMDPANTTMPTPFPTFETNSPTQEPITSPVDISFPSSSEPTNNILSRVPTRSPSNSDAPTFIDREFRYDQLVKALTFRGITNANALLPAGGGKTPQIRALDWLLDEDSLNLLAPNARTPTERVLQRYILATFFFSTSDKDWEKSWLDSSHECEWFGVACVDKKVSSATLFEEENGFISDINQEESMVVALNLEKNNLKGTISHEIGFLEDCTILSLYGNELYGGFPTSLGRLFSLNKLWIDVNDITGSLPSEIGLLRNVDDIQLYGNQLSGTLPSELGELTRLKRFWASDMLLSGSIPTEFGQLTNLSDLYLESNSFSGEIPSELGLIENLHDIRLFQNSLSGSLPREFFGLSKLKVAYMDDNRLEGKISSQIDGLESILDFQLFSNRLSGTLPYEIGLLKNLKVLRLNSNFLTGTIPDELGFNGELLRLTLSNNNFDGSIPNSLTKSSSIKRIELDRNKLEGSLPDWIGGLDQLMTLNVADNRLQGKIPSSLGVLQNLEEVRLEQNALTGSVPGEWCSLNSLRNGIIVSDCGGSFPEVICACCSSCSPTTSKSYQYSHIRRK